MKKWLAVGVVGLGALGLLMMRNTKTAIAAPQAQARELAPLQLIQKYRCRVSPAVSIISRHSPSAGS